MKNILLFLSALVLSMSCGNKKAHNMEDNKQDTHSVAIAEHLKIAPRRSNISVKALSDGIYAVAFTAKNIDWHTHQISCKIFSKDVYPTDEIKRMRVGDTLVYEGKPMTVKSVKEVHKSVMINDGIENNGAELKCDNKEGGYVATVWDDHAVYTEVGSVKLKLSKAFVFINCGENYTDPSDTIRVNQQQYFNKMPSFSKDNFWPINTNIVVKEGVVTTIQRRWIP